MGTAVNQRFRDMRTRGARALPTYVADLALLVAVVVPADEARVLPLALDALHGHARSKGT
jgi:hypothetical protein